MPPVGVDRVLLAPSHFKKLRLYIWPDQDSYIVIDSSAVMMLPEQYQLPVYSLRDIEKMADDRGVTVDAETEKLIAEARAEAKKAIKELEAQSDALLEQFRQYQ